MIPRTKERNNSNIIVFHNDLIQYINVTPDELLNVFMYHYYSWAANLIYQVFRKTSIVAYPAREGELLQTELNNSIITYNIAQRGDWKVKKLSNGTEYFLSSQQMEKLYEFDFDNKDSEIKFKPKSHIVEAIELTSPILIQTPWSHPQYLSKGDFIIKRDDNDIYGVKRENFYSDYELVSSFCTTYSQ